MNDTNGKVVETYRSLLLMSEISADEPISQRELAHRLGIALGLVNSYIRNLVDKGFVRVKSFPRNRYGYLLTPQGFAEKSRLVYRHLNYFTNLYKAARQDYLELFRALKLAGASGVIFCGVDEVAEIAYLSLRETGLALEAVVDDEQVEDVFFERKIAPLVAVTDGNSSPIIITSLKRGDELKNHLLLHGISGNRIFHVGNAASLN